MPALRRNQNAANQKLAKENLEAIRKGKALAKSCISQQALPAQSDDSDLANDDELLDTDEDEEDDDSQADSASSTAGNVDTSHESGTHGATEEDQYLDSVVEHDNSNPATGYSLNGDGPLFDAQPANTCATDAKDVNAYPPAPHSSSSEAAPSTSTSITIKVEPGTSAAASKREELILGLKRKILDGHGQNGNGTYSAQFKKAKRNGTAIIVATIVYRDPQGTDEELATIFLRTNSFKTFLNSLPKTLPFFKTDSTLAYLEKQLGIHHQHLWAFLTTLLHHPTNPKYNFQSFSFLSTFSPMLESDNEYYDLKETIVQHIQAEPMDENCTFGYDDRPIYLEPKQILISEPQINVLVTLGQLFDLRTNESCASSASTLNRLEEQDHLQYGRGSTPRASSSSSSQPWTSSSSHIRTVPGTAPNAPTLAGHCTPPHPDAATTEPKTAPQTEPNTAPQTEAETAPESTTPKTAPNSTTPKTTSETTPKTTSETTSKTATPPPKTTATQNNTKK